MTMKLTHYGAAVGLISLLISTTAFGKTNLTVNKADDFISQWVAIENQHSNLKKQWSDTKQLLNQRITLLTQEKKQLSALTSNNNKQVDEVTQARQKLLTLQTSIEAKQKLLTQWLADEFIQVNNTLAQLPPPLQKSWQSVLSEVDENNLSKQLESLLSLYQKYDEFNNRVSTQQATVIDSTGQEIMVEQLFLGVARGWYLTLDGKTAVAGMSTPAGWQWQYDHPVSAQTIKDALAMLAHKMEARLITLPMSLSAKGEASAQLSTAQPSGQ